MIVPLSPDERAEALLELTAWTYDDERRALHREIVLSDFTETFALMVRIALKAEKADHHPEWSNVYNRLDIRLTTHDANGVTERDTALAREIDAILATR